MMKKHLLGWMFRTEKWKRFPLKSASRHSGTPISVLYLPVLYLSEVALLGSSHLEQGRPAPVAQGLPPPPLPSDRQRFPAGQRRDWGHFILPSLLSGLPALFIFNAFDSFPCCFDQATSSHLLPPGGVNSSYCSICRPQTHRRADFAMSASQVSISKYYAAFLALKIHRLN